MKPYAQLESVSAEGLAGLQKGRMRKQKANLNKIRR